MAQVVGTWDAQAGAGDWTTHASPETLAQFKGEGGELLGTDRTIEKLDHQRLLLLGFLLQHLLKFGHGGVQVALAPQRYGQIAAQAQAGRGNRQASLELAYRLALQTQYGIAEPQLDVRV